MPGIDGAFHFGRAGGFDTDDFHVRTGLLDRGGHAGGQSAAANRHEHGGDVRALVEDFETSRALTGNDPLVIERRDHRQAAA